MVARNGRKKTSGGLMRLIDPVLFLATLAVGVALLLSFFAGQVDPEDVVWFAFLGLAAPFLYIANVVLMLYWIIRWRPIAFFCICLTLIGLLHLNKFFRPQIKRQFEHVESREGTLRILSYNVCGFWGKENGQYVSRMVEIADYIREADPDIVCMQEYEINHVNTERHFDSIMADFPYKSVSYRVSSPNEWGWGLAIYSKYRILNQESMFYPESTNSSMWVDIAVHRDTIRVYNNHLQTTQINEEDRGFLGTAQLSDSLFNDKAKNIVKKLARNFKVRASQADSIAELIHDRKTDLIVCGDFNDTPMSYTYKQMRGGLVDPFQRQGEGLAHTYRGLKGLFRIDFIFHSKDFETVRYLTEYPDWSDHNPVIVDIRRK